MKPKIFIRNLSQCIFEEYKQEIPKEELKSSFVEAIKNISAGRLQDELNTNFDKNLKRLEKSLKSLCVRELPSVSNIVDDSLEELTKSELDGRTDVEEHSTKFVHKVLYNMMEKELKRPQMKAMKKLDNTQRYLTYRTFLQKVLNREDVSDLFIKTVIQDFDDLCEISKNKNTGTSKFEWLPMCDLLLQLAAGSKPLAFIRVLKVLFDAIQNDVNRCLANHKTKRANNLSKVLKKFLTVCHLGIDQKNMKDSEGKKYRKYVSALLSFYVDLCCTLSRNLEHKKLFGKEMAGFVCYLLQPWPESLLEVALQLQGHEDENYNILLPLINKCLETRPRGADYVYYLKYVLLVRQIKDAFGEFEPILEWNFATKSIPAKAGFLGWLKEECPEALEHVPIEDKNFKKTKITRFLLEEAEDDLITILLNSLSKDDEVSPTENITPGTDVAIETENLFYLDTGGGSFLELADEESSEVPRARQTPKKAEIYIKGITKETKSKHKPIVLKTLEEVEKLVDTEVQGNGTSSPQTYTLDPEFVMEKVIDPEDRKFLQSEIISITSVSSISQGDETLIDNEESEVTAGKERNSEDSSTDKSGKGLQSNSSTPNRVQKHNKIGKNSKEQEADNSDISEIEKTEDFPDPVTSASEDDHRIKSVVRKVTPRKAKAALIQEKSGPDTQGLVKITRNETNNDSENVITIDEDIAIKTQDNVCELSCDTDNTKHDESLSSVHESSVEMVDIILEGAEQFKNRPDTESSQGKKSLQGGRTGNETPGRKRESVTEIESPRKRGKSKSPIKKCSSRSPVSISSSKTDDSTVPENNLSCMSDLTSTTSLSEKDSYIKTATDTCTEDQNSTIEELELNDTVKCFGKKVEGSPLTSPSDSEILSDRRRRISRKSSSGEGEDNLDGTNEKQKLSDSDVPTGMQIRSSRKSSSGDGKITLDCLDEKQKGYETHVPADRPRRSSRKSSSGRSKDELSETDENQNDSNSYAPKDRSHRLSRKSVSGTENIGVIGAESQRKSPRKGHSSVSEIYIEDESDADVFGKSPEKRSKIELEEKNTKSIKQKFIEKATKGKKSPMKIKEQAELNPTQEVSGSVSLFPDEYDSDSVVENEANNESGQRTKSTEEIFKIVEEIKEKIKTPLTRKSMSKDKEKLNESMFTDESIESLQNELNVSTKKLESPENKVKLKSSSETDNNRKTSCCSTPSTEKKMKETNSRKKSLNDENPDFLHSPSKRNTISEYDKKTPSKYDTSGSLDKIQNNLVVIDLIEDDTDVEQQGKEDEIDKGIFTEISEITRPNNDKEENNSRSYDKRNSKTSEPEYTHHTPSPTRKIQARQSPRTAECNEKPKEIINLTGTNGSTFDLETNASLDIKEMPEKNSKTNAAIKTTPNKTDPCQATHDGDETCPDSDDESEGKGTVESETEVIGSRRKSLTENYEMTDSETDTRKTNMINRTPKKQIDEKKSSPDLIAEKRTPKSANKDGKNEQKDVIKTPKGQKSKVATPKSDSKRTNKNSETDNIVKTPKSDEHKSLSPVKSKSASKVKSLVDSHKMEEKPTDSGGDFVPSSVKKKRTKSNIFGSDRTKETTILLSSSESDKELMSYVDLSVHLKTDSRNSNKADSKSPPSQSKVLAISSQKRIDEITPLKGKRPVQRTKGSPKSPVNIVDQGSTTKRKQTRNKNAEEPVSDSVETEMEAEGPTRSKRLRSAAKAVSITVVEKPTASKGRATKGKSDLNKVHWSQSESDATDLSDFETRRTRKSIGSRKMTAIKDKISEVEEEPEKVLRTPPAKIVKQRKVSASTSKKAVKKLDELRGTRKRRLSGEFSTGNNSTDSEVSFPKLKNVTASEKKVPKRLSTPAVQTTKEPAKDSGKRYSLRKK